MPCVSPGRLLTPFLPARVLSLVGAGTLSPRLTFSRASGAWAFDSAGTLQAFAANAPRFAYDLAGNYVGMRLESPQTNLIRNPRGEGNTSSGGPTNWSVFVQPGLTAVSSVLSVQGMDVVQVRFTGTPTGSGDHGVNLESAGGIAVSPATPDIVTFTSLLRIVAGGLAAGSSARTRLQERGGSTSPATEVSMTATLDGTWRPISNTRTITQSGTTSVIPAVLFSTPKGTPVDMTVQIAIPRVEKGIWTSSIILPPVGSRAASTRAIERISSTPLLLRNAKPATYLMEFYLENRADPNTNITLLRESGSGTNLAQVYIARGGTGLTAALQLRDAAGALSNGGLGDAVLGRNKVALVISPNLFAGCMNGGTPRSFTSGTDYSSMSSFSASDIPGGVRSLKVFPRTFSNTQLQAMTAL